MDNQFQFDDRIHVLEEHDTPDSIMRSIAESGYQENAFMVCDIGDVVQKYQNWTIKFPRIKPHFAVKVNDNLKVIEVLAALGANFDCASQGEIVKILKLGVHPSRIIFAHTIKLSSHIKYAKKNGIDIMTFDNKDELYKLKRLYPTARLLLRFKFDSETSLYNLGKKFGCDPDTEATDLLKTAQTLKLNIIGLAFHVGSSCLEIDIFEKAISKAKDVFNSAKKMGFDFQMLDIGGGFPGETGTTIDEHSNVINRALDRHFSDLKIQIIAEPGRYFVSSAFNLATYVNSYKQEDTTEGPYYQYYINDGIFNSCAAVFYGEVFPAYTFKNEKNPVFNSTVWGASSSYHDIVVHKQDLPKLEIGDWIIFKNMGAYTITLGSFFNGVPEPKVHVVADLETFDILKKVLPIKINHYVMSGIPVNIKLKCSLEGYKYTHYIFKPYK